MIKTLVGLLFSLSASFALGAGDYLLESHVLDGGGGLGASSNYSLVHSISEGVSGNGTAYASRGGFVGRLPFGLATQLVLSAFELTVNEEGTRQIDAEIFYDDGSSAVLPGTSVTWSIVEGPLASISANGLVTADAVYADTTAVLRSESENVFSMLQLTVLEAIEDNFRSYAADDLPDDWQVEYLGIDDPDGGPGDDADSDGESNLIEFAFGTNPGNSGSGVAELDYSGTLAGSGTLVATGQPVRRYESLPFGVDYRLLFVRRKDYADRGLTYTPQFSTDMSNWVNGTGTIEVLADDGEHEVVSIRYPFFIVGRKTRFFRIGLYLDP
ncbi:MAG: hypothetical protein AAGA58_09515 [Verrucomicrobiota bacterium]